MILGQVHATPIEHLFAWSGSSATHETGRLQPGSWGASASARRGARPFLTVLIDAQAQVDGLAGAVVGVQPQPAVTVSLTRRRRAGAKGRRAARNGITTTRVTT